MSWTKDGKSLAIMDSLTRGLSIPMFLPMDHRRFIFRYASSASGLILASIVSKVSCQKSSCPATPAKDSEVTPLMTFSYS